MEKVILKIRHVLPVVLVFLLGSAMATEPVFYPRPAIVNPQKNRLPSVDVKNLGDEAIWYEDFDGGLPANWTSVDLSGYVSFTHSYEGPQGGFSQGVPAINSSSAANGFMILDSDLASEDNDMGLTDAYIQSPPIDLSGHPHVMLSFQHFFRYCCSFQSTQLLVEVSNDGENWVSFDVKNGVWPNNLSQNAIHQLVNISEVAAGHEQVWIRFRKIGASHYFWMIDDVSINTYTANDLELFAVAFGGYTMVPGGQQQPVFFSGMIRNLGGNTQTGVHLLTDVNTYLYKGQSETLTQLASGHTTTLSTQTAFTFPGRGLYNINFEAKQNQPDTEPTNNLALGRVQITDTVYARDGGIYLGEGIRAGVGQAFVTGNVFEILQDVRATSVSVALHEMTQAGAQITARIYQRQGASFTQLAQTTPYSVSQHDLSVQVNEEAVWLSLPLSGDGLWLEGSQQYLVAISYTGGAGNLMISSEIPRGLPGQGAFTQIDGMWQTESQVPMIRLNLGDNVADCAPFYEVNTTEAYCGNDDGQATIIPLTGFGPHTFLWDTDPWQTSATAMNLGVGQILVEVWDASGCHDTLYVSIGSQNLEMEFEAQASACGAPNGEATVIPLAGFGPYTFSWETDPPQSGPTASGLPPGTYSVLVTDNIGCQGVIEVVVEENDFLLVDAQVQNPVCVANNGSILLQPDGGSEPFVYQWIQLPDLDGNLAENLAAGTYTVMITDQSGCESEMEFALEFEEVELELSAAVTPETCEMSNAAIVIEVDNATAPVNYYWSNGATVGSLHDIGAGEYSVTILDAFGCETQASFTITNTGELPRVSSFASNSPGCGQSGGTALIIPQNPDENLVYEWSTGETTPNIENVPAGIYFVNIVNPAENCVLEYPVLIKDAGAPVVNSVVSPILCNGDANGAITVSVTGGLNPVYNWVHGAEGQTIADLGPGTYIVTVSDGNCFTGQQFDITQPEILHISYQFDEIMCHGQTTNINVGPLGGTYPYSFYWSNGLTGTEMNNVSGGEFWVQVIDFHECAYKLPLNIHEPEPIEVEADLVIPDVGQNNGSIHLTVSGGTGNLSYSWNTGATTPALTNLPIGTYTVTILDENNCSEVISYNLSPAGMDDVMEIPMALYPNPALDYAWIEFGENPGEKLVIRLHDLSGKVVREVASRQFLAGERLRIDLAGISQGFYFLTIKGSNVNSQLKLIKH
ncbi:MAG: T9SS type A sorting domain-containing protein [Bacteroidales bacterium]|nr:T9SS type A sorting domain-containing protein [Bacteroidales bacterium]